MSLSELDRLKVVEKIRAKRLTQAQGAKELDLSTRQVIRLCQNYDKDGPKGLISKRRGKASNNRLNDELKDQIVQLIKEKYSDFGPTLAHEQLVEAHQLEVSVETVRKLMIKEGIWQGKKRKAVKHHPMRLRRSALGELVQIDGSTHDWFEGRGPKCCLLVFIDDATSRLMALHFLPEECTEGYFKTTQRYLKQHGRPLTFYSDRHSIFRVNIKEAKNSTGETQFSRAMRELGIELICANSPQAKGRVEKANRTLQDRLVKMMRLKNINSIETANAYLPEFIEDYNKRFADEPCCPENAHRKSIPPDDVLNLILSQQAQRKLSKNLEFSYKNAIYQVQIKGQGYGMRGSQVTVCEQEEGVVLIYKNRILDYKVHDKNQSPTPIKTAKQVEVMKLGTAHKPAADHPWRSKYDKTPRKAS